MRTNILICGIIALLATPMIAQQQPKVEAGTTPKAQTKIEAFQRQTGQVIIKGYDRIGSVKAMGTAEVTAMEFTNATAGDKQYGITIEVKEVGRIEREVNSFVDYDEIDPLLAGIDYIAKVTAAATAFTGFEAIYQTRGDVQLIVFNDPKTAKVSAALKCGNFGSATMFLDLPQLAELRKLVVAAKQLIDKNKAATPKR